MLNSEIICERMIAAGNRFIDAQQVELKLSKHVNRGRQDAEFLEQWKTARRAVERLAQEYAQAVARAYSRQLPLHLFPGAQAAAPIGVHIN